MISPLNIDTLDDQVLTERVASFQGGADSFHSAIDLPPQTSQIMRNFLVQDNFYAVTRYGADAITGAALDTGIIQGLQWFSVPGSVGNSLLAAVNRRIWKWDGTNATQLSNSFTLSDATSPLASIQAFGKVYFSDGVQQWYSWDGNVFTGLGTASGVSGNPPVGTTIMCFHTGRVFCSGTITNQGTTTNDAIFASAIAGPTQFDWMTWSFRVSAGDGDKIQGLASLQDFWLLVMKQNSLWLVNADPSATSADLWQIQNLTRGIGLVAPRAWAQNGNDVIFLAQDGIRSVQRMAAAVDQYEVVPPLSEPVKAYIDRINWQYVSTSCAWRYHQWILFAIPVDAATSPNFVLVFNTRTQTWMGYWDGWTPTCFATTFFNGSQNLMIGDSLGKVNQWKDDKSEDLASTFQDNGVNIPSLVRSKAFNFEWPLNAKDLEFVEIRFTDTETVAQGQMYLDDQAQPQFTMDTRSAGPNLPVNLDFYLASGGPQVFRISMRGMPDFDECFLEISATSGKLKLKNYTLTAYLNTFLNSSYYTQIPSNNGN
jgi:hypothetical protein